MFSAFVRIFSPCRQICGSDRSVVRGLWWRGARGSWLRRLRGCSVRVWHLSVGTSVSRTQRLRADLQIMSWNFGLKCWVPRMPGWGCRHGAPVTWAGPPWERGGGGLGWVEGCSVRGCVCRGCRTGSVQRALVRPGSEHIYYRTEPQFFNRNIVKRGRERKEGKTYLKPHTKLRDRLSWPVCILAFWPRVKRRKENWTGSCPGWRGSFAGAGLAKAVWPIQFALGLQWSFLFMRGKTLP